MKEGIKILLAYDGSDHAKKALSEAIPIAEKFSGSINLLYCCWDESDEASMLMLKDTEKQLKKAGVKYEYMSERTSNPPERILSVAHECGFDLIVMGSRGIGRARAWLMGSVSSKVVAEATISVLVVK